MKKLELTPAQFRLLKGMLNKISTRDNGNRDYSSLYYDLAPKAPDILFNICEKLNRL